MGCDSSKEVKVLPSNADHMENGIEIEDLDEGKLLYFLNILCSAFVL